MSEKEVLSAEIVQTESSNPLMDLERASIDMQIATAHRFCRSMENFKKNALALVTLDEDTAASCLYRRPVGKDKNGNETYAEGMSIRLAEIVAACYGNLRVGTRVIESTPRYVVVQGVAHDLESNYLSTAECKESTVKRNGQPYDERMRVVIEKAAAAKARRDAIFNVVPRASAKFLEVAAKNLLFGNASSITKWRTRIAAWVKTLGIDGKRVWAALGIEGAADLKQPEIETLIGIQNALKSGETDLDTAFPPLESSKFTGAALFKSAPKAETSAPEAPAAPEKSDVEKLADFIAERGIPVAAEQVKTFVESKGEIFSFDMVKPNVNRIAEAILQGDGK